MTLSPDAIIKIRAILAEEKNPNLKLRIYVQGGGCSGFQQGFSLDETQEEDDLTLVYDDVTVLVDPMSMQYLQGSLVRFEESAMGDSFVIDNPNSTGSCGCGSSFSM